MEKDVQAGKTEKILLGLTTVFLCGLLALSAGDRQAVRPGLEAEPEQPVPQESFVPEVKPVNLNTATLEELDSLPGIGQTLARRILEYRKTNGPFETVEELMEISGIGEAKFAELEQDVMVERKD